MPIKRRTRKDRRINIASSRTSSSSSQYGSQNYLCDTSWPLFSLYSNSKMVGEGDENFERIQKSVEVMLLFIGLFAATLAALITVSIQDLRPGQQDSSPFSPPTYAIWVNSLWISSLIINIISALLATLIQQWARRYDRIIQLGSPHNRARIRQYIFNGDDSSHFLLAIDGVPSLLHLSVFLFFAGLLILLRHISHTVFNAVVGWIALCVVYYVYITFLPIFRPDSPHYSPISSLAWQLYSDILYTVIEPFLEAKRRIRNMDIRLPAARLLQRLEEKVKETALDKSPRVDASILESLLDTLDEDGAREKFLEAIPGFYDSKVVHVQDMNQNLSPTFFTNFRRTVNLFLDQTLSSDSVSELVRSHRLLACLNATQTVLGGRAGTSITDQIIRSEIWNERPSPEMVQILTRWRNSTGSSVALIGNCIIARIIATVEKRDDTWMALTTSQLGVTEDTLRSYLEHGDSVLLDNLIKTTRLFFEKGLQFQGILRSISEFNFRDTLPELQQDFCALWNEIVEKNKHSGQYIFILDEIRHVHAALHSTAPTTVALLPTSTANNDGLLLGSSYELCADAPSRHARHPPNASRQFTAFVTSSSSSPLGVPPLSSPLQRDETNINRHVVSDTTSLPDPLTPLRELPVEIRTHVPPALNYSDTTTTSYSLPSPRDVSFSDPGVVVVAGERDIRDLNAHDPHQSDSRDGDWNFSMNTPRPGKSDN